ncbi:MAG: methylmalonyl Co-A mutase-associated GTPase MeaB [Rubrivivax sp.]|nr:methylmalonyl Co-A mutase-associated GTPase MeaB [Rubrivivax sp.]
MVDQRRALRRRRGVRRGAGTLPRGLDDPPRRVRGARRRARALGGAGGPSAAHVLRHRAVARGPGPACRSGRVLGHLGGAARLAGSRRAAGLPALRRARGSARRVAVTQGPAPLPPGDAALVEAIVGPAGPRQRRAVAKAITLLESTRADHRARADQLLNALLPASGRAFRLGISGVPGVGKSTFIETLGLMLVERGERVAVLAVDPSSVVGGGAILGDKTRMEQLSVHERAFIRPSPASGTLGGVAEKTREAMRLCEAAGHGIVIVETVGVGQSEAAVAGMTDMFVLLQLPNAGDDLQAIKRGVMELADLVVINKADLDEAAATRARAQITSALRIFGLHGHPGRAAHDAAVWQPQVLQLSARTGQGLQDFWQAVERFRALQQRSGALERRRHAQDQAWMWERIDSGLRERFRRHPAVRAALPDISEQVRAGTVAASVAARRLLDLAA